MHRLRHKLAVVSVLSRCLILLILRKLIIALWHFLVVGVLKLSDESIHTLRYLMTSLLIIKSPATDISFSEHLASCLLKPNYMNSVFDGFIFSLALSIHCLILSIHCWRLLMVCSSAFLLLALKESLMLWSSANPLIFKPGWTASSKRAQYRLKMLAPAQLPCGTLTSKSCSWL